MRDRPASLSWLRLAFAEKVGLQQAFELLRAFGSPDALYATPPEELDRLLGPARARRVLAPPNPARLEATLAWLAGGPNRHLLTLDDPAYPPALLQIADPPLLLFAEGRLELLDGRGLAIVGSRNATPQGVRNARAFAETLSAAGLTIVSGLALGIDAAAHEGGLAGPGASVAVIGTGPDIDYPASNRALAARLRTAGCVVSEFAPGTPPLANHFPRRNRIISALARGVLVVEAAERSGSLVTARLAGEQGRDVFAIPGSIHAPLARGCHALIKQGAKLVESAADVLDELAWAQEPQGAEGREGRQDSALVEPAQQAAAPPAESALLAAMGHDPIDADTLAHRLMQAPAEVANQLLTLELAGRIALVPGGRYQRID